MQTASGLKPDEFFQLFAFEQTLKHYDPSYDELQNEDVDSGDDGGIDGFYFFVNGELILESIETEFYKKKPQIDLYLIQAKNTASFRESPIEKVATTSARLFALDRDLTEFGKEFNSELIQHVGLFRETYLKLAPLQPKLSVTFAYVTKGNTADVHIKVRSKAEHLQDVLLSCFHGADVKTVFYGARELLELARTEKSYTLQLRFKELLTAGQGEAYVVSVGLDEYLNFITSTGKPPPLAVRLEKALPSRR